MQQAAAPHDTLVAVVVAVLAGGAILFPSLALLFRLDAAGRLGPRRATRRPSPLSPRAGLDGCSPSPARGCSRALAGACLLAGVGFLTIAEAGWAHAIGVVALLGFVIVGFLRSCRPR